MLTKNTLLIAAASAISLSGTAAAREYQDYRGDGTVGDGWPTTSDWADFDTMQAPPLHPPKWRSNTASNSGSCSWLGLAPNSNAENDALKSAIKQAGSDSDLDPRFILAAVFQESAGCVRVKTSYSPNEGIRNPGLLQCGDGDHTCNDPKAGVEMLNPCPDEQILGMITDGVGLTTDVGLMQVVDESEAEDDSKYYKGAVLYNSGILPESGNLGQGRSNPCYASDIANRAMGWVGDESPCDRDTIGN